MLVEQGCFSPGHSHGNWAGLLVWIPQYFYTKLVEEWGPPAGIGKDANTVSQ